MSKEILTGARLGAWLQSLEKGTLLCDRNGAQGDAKTLADIGKFLHACKKSEVKAQVDQTLRCPWTDFPGHLPDEAEVTCRDTVATSNGKATQALMDLLGLKDRHVTQISLKIGANECWELKIRQYVTEAQIVKVAELLAEKAGDMDLATFTVIYSNADPQASS